MEIVNSCPVCKNNNFNKILKCQDYTVSYEYFDIEECNNCGFRLTNPRPNVSEIGKYYISNEYISHSDTNKGLINKIYKLVRNYTIKRKTKLIASLLENNKTGDLLDIGCGTGSFIKYSKEVGWNVHGTEPDDKTRKYAISNSKCEITKDYLQLSNENKYDIITMWHVLEHIHDLNQTILKLKNLIKENGYILIAVPNHESHDGVKFESYWAAYDVPRHLSHFSKKDITTLFSDHGMKVKEIKPMLFDSFYISMISTKYRDGKINYIESFYEGIKSNIKAKKNNNYSSLIYIISK